MGGGPLSLGARVCGKLEALRSGKMMLEEQPLVLGRGAKRSLSFSRFRWAAGPWEGSLHDLLDEGAAEVRRRARDEADWELLAYNGPQNELAHEEVPRLNSSFDACSCGALLLDPWAWSDRKRAQTLARRLNVTRNLKLSECDAFCAECVQWRKGRGMPLVGTAVTCTSQDTAWLGFGLQAATECGTLHLRSPCLASALYAADRTPKYENNAGPYGVDALVLTGLLQDLDDSKKTSIPGEEPQDAKEAMVVDLFHLLATDQDKQANELCLTPSAVVLASSRCCYAAGQTTSNASLAKSTSQQL